MSYGGERSGSAASPSRSARALAIGSIAFAASALVYLPALRNGFVNWDDLAFVAENHHLRTSGWVFLKWAFGTLESQNWTPVTWISHHLDYRLWGLDPFGHHLTSVLLHAANSALVALLATRLVQLADERGTTRGSFDATARGRFSLCVGAIAGILFAVHPIHVESVAWVAERKDVLCAFFYLLAILVYVQGRCPGGRSEASGSGARKGPHRAGLRYGSCLALFLLAMASKPMAVSLPWVLLLLDWYPLGRLHPTPTTSRGAAPRSAVLEKIPFFASSILVAVLTLFAQQASHAVYSLAEYSLVGRLYVSIRSPILYLQKIFLPVELVPYYPFPAHPSLASASFLIPAALVGAITLGSLLLARRWKPWPVAWASYLLLLAPTLGIVKVGRQAMADRYAYLPSAIVLMLVALACARMIQPHRSERWIRSRTVAALTGLGLALLACSAKTTAQIRIWSDGVSLWNAVCRANPRDRSMAFAYLNLGSALSSSRRYQEAMEAYRDALRIDPDIAGVYNNIGNAQVGLGRLEDAIAAYRRAIEISATDINAHVNLGNAYDMMGRLAEAQREYRKALALDPGHAKAHYNLAIVYERLGARAEAIREYREALRLAPGYSRAEQRLRAALERRPGGEGSAQE